MAEFALSDLKVGKYEVLTVRDFAASLGSSGVAPESIYYAIKNGMVDYVRADRVYLIVNTPHTRQYKPNNANRVDSPRPKAKSKPKRKK